MNEGADLLAKWGTLGVLRCCQDWPTHFEAAVFYSGTCGKCGKEPEFIFNFPPEQFIKRENTE